jgi:hypothetical protein
MNFFEEDEELKREIEEEVQRLRLEERKKYVHSRALAILQAGKDKLELQKAMEREPQGDFYIQFIEETIVKTGNEEDVLSSSDIYQQFDRWLKIHYPATRRPSLAQMKADLLMSGRLGPQERRGIYVWIGYRLKI